VRTPRPVIALAAFAIALTTAACDPLSVEPASPGSGADVPAVADVASAEEARKQLAALAVGEWATMSGYSRDRFDHWSSQGDGCDTRDVVLQRDGTGVVVGDSCRITAGSWFSPYDGATHSDPRDVDIDHMVPLANAWRTGAKDWTDEQREQFANDLERPQLRAVTAAVNRSKGDQDPSQWRPPRQEFWCTYAQEWIAVKAFWQLRVTVDEKDALEEMLETCP